MKRELEEEKAGHKNTHARTKTCVAKLKEEREKLDKCKRKRAEARAENRALRRELVYVKRKYKSTRQSLEHLMEAVTEGEDAKRTLVAIQASRKARSWFDKPASHPVDNIPTDTESEDEAEA